MWLSLVLIIWFVMEPYSSYSFQATGRFHFRDFTLQQRSALKSYERLLVRLGRLKNQKEFLIECRKEQVVPHSLNVRLMVVESPFPSAHKENLSDRILPSKRQVDHAFWCVR